MGVEYTLANHKDKICFELGKGSWYALCQDRNRTGHECLLYEDTIYEMITEEIWDYNISNPGNGERADTWKKAAEELAAELFKFVNDADPTEISLVNDSDDSESNVREKGYRWVGSRYKSSELEQLNRHLKE
jgi:hypothetical protein